MKSLKKAAALFTALTLTAVSLPVLHTQAFSATDEPPYMAWLMLQAGGEKHFNYEGDPDADPDDNPSTGNDAMISGDGSYFAEVNFATGSESIELLILQTNINGYAFIHPEGGEDILKDTTVKINIDRVVVISADGTEREIPYNGPGDTAFGKGDDGVSLRLNLYNIWGNKVTDIPNNGEAGLEPILEGDTLRVEFTVSGLSYGGGYSMGDVNADAIVDTEDAYMVLSEFSALGAGMESTFSNGQTTAADVSGDGIIDTEDASRILAYFSAVGSGGLEEGTTAADFFANYSA